VRFVGLLYARNLMDNLNFEVPEIVERQLGTCDLVDEVGSKMDRN
jgi:hypothetical protein